MEISLGEVESATVAGAGVQSADVASGSASTRVANTGITGSGLAEDALTDERFANPFWWALETEQRRFAVGDGAGQRLARRYPAEVIPFGALKDASAEALRALRDLLEPDETIYVNSSEPLDAIAEVEGLVCVKALPCWQMHFPVSAAVGREETGLIRRLEVGDAAAMVKLTDVAFPGFFRPRGYEPGPFYGIHVDGELVAMAGERVAVPGFREISAVCTHPAYTGRGYGAMLVEHVVRAHRAVGLKSFLHVLEKNVRAVGLYERLGFCTTRRIPVYQLQRL